MKFKYCKFLFPIALLFFWACGSQENNISEKTDSPKGSLPLRSLKVINNSTKEFDAYWYQGKAEVSSYDLEQARYGEMRKGEVVLIFVTEDFYVNSQVKKERETSEDAVSVLKLNFLRKFPTGIYDYSLMTSTFSPVNVTATAFPLKSSTSSQDWCGHSWMQLNREQYGYSLSSFSYFQNEGDRQKELDNVLLEDGLWAQIRMNWELIPKGDQLVFPGTHYLRFSHEEAKAYEAKIELEESDSLSSDSLRISELSIQYPTLNRTLSIFFQNRFPHEIIGWEERRMSGYGDKARMMTTKATKKVQMLSPYWDQHGTDDAFLRDLLRRKQLNH